MRTYELTSPVYAALEATAIEAWAAGEPFTQRALSGPIAEILGRDADRVAPYAFNFTSRPIGEATLRQALEPFLGDSEVPDTAKRSVRSALRFVLGLPTQCADDVLLASADRVNATELYDLPARIYDLAVRPPATLGEQTAKNYRTAIRRLLRYAGTRRLVPVVFPRLWVSDPWEVAKNRYFPLASEGRTDMELLGFRSAWMALAEAAVAKHGEAGRDPARLTRAKAELTITYTGTRSALLPDDPSLWQELSL